MDRQYTVFRETLAMLFTGLNDRARFRPTLYPSSRRSPYKIPAVFREAVWLPLKVRDAIFRD